MSSNTVSNSDAVSQGLSYVQSDILAAIALEQLKKLSHSAKSQTVIMFKDLSSATWQKKETIRSSTKKKFSEQEKEISQGFRQKKKAII